MSKTNIKHRILRYLHADSSLEERVFLTMLSVGVVASLISFAVSFLLRLDMIARVSTLLCAVWFASLQVIGYHRPDKQYACRVMLVCGVSFVIFPFGFFSAGGVSGGMTLLYLLAVFNTAILLRPPLRNILLGAQILVADFTVYLSRSYSHFLADLTEQQHYFIARLFLFISSVTLAMMCVQILKSYEEERERSRKLTEQLSNLSVRDPLTGLYNRRELFRRLELVYMPDVERSERDGKLTRQGCYIAMFDVDNFKQLNDTYGHQFGDTVLACIANRFRDAVTPAAGELAARYGGEEFVCVLCAPCLEDAFKRVDQLRAGIESLAWAEVPGLHVTISGGLVSCERCPQPDQAMHDVDALLYQAKNTGKNRIETQLHSLYPQKRA